LIKFGHVAKLLLYVAQKVAIATVRRRAWANRKGGGVAWIADYFVRDGKRHIRSFRLKADAQRWLQAATGATGRKMRPPRSKRVPAPGTVPDLIACLGAAEDVSDVVRRSGIYFLCKGGKLVWMGPSSDVGGHIGRRRGPRDFDRIFFLPWPEDEFDWIEVIRRLAEAQTPTTAATPSANLA